MCNDDDGGMYVFIEVYIRNGKIWLMSTSLEYETMDMKISAVWPSYTWCSLFRFVYFIRIMPTELTDLDNNQFSMQFSCSCEEVF